MKRNKVNNSDIVVSVLGMGCWAYGGGRYWGPQDQNDVNEVVLSALDNGINYFDTAEVYNEGDSERSLGIALKGRRNEAVIGTKISPSNTRPQTLKKHCEASLNRLGTDYIDIYMLHWPINAKSVLHFSQNKDLQEPLPSLQEAFETLLLLKSEGKIRQIGISNHGIRQMEEIDRLGVDIAVNELPYNLVSRAIEHDILPYCIKNSITVLGYMALQQGVLSGKYPTFDSIPPSQVHSRHFSLTRGGEESRHGEEGAEEEILALLREMKSMAEELKTDLPALSLSWAMSKEGIGCTIIGTRNIDQLRTGILTASTPLPAAAVKKLDILSEPVLKRLGTNPDYYENRNDSRIT